MINDQQQARFATFKPLKSLGNTFLMEFYGWDRRRVATWQSKASTRRELARGRLWAHFSTRFFSLSRSPIATYEAEARWKQLQKQRLLGAFYRTSFFYSRTSRQKRGNWQTQIHLFKKGVSGYIYQEFNEVLHSVWKSLKISRVIFATFGAKIKIR